MGKKKGAHRRAVAKNDETLINQDLDERKKVVLEGKCMKGICGEEAACQELDNKYTCLCTHDSLPPTARGTCPRRIVESVKPGAGVIPNVQPPSNKHLPIRVHIGPLTNTTAAPQIEQSTTLPVTTTNYLVITIPPVIIGLIFIVCCVICIKKRRRPEKDGDTPISLKHGLLEQERYTPNPQYSPCAVRGGIPVLRPESLKFLHEIGEGYFGKVYKGELHLKNNEVRVVAIKILKDKATKEAEDDFEREVEIMSAFRHANILPLLGIVEREPSVRTMMVFEFMPYGDLTEVLRAQTTSSNDRFPQLLPKDLLNVSLQIARGMKYLADQRFVHRDLACRNCLVAEGLVVKIADFGLSRDVYTCDYYKMGGSRILPVRWMSPESVVYGRFTLESDVWSYGIVLWEIYSYGKQPYYGHSNEEVVKLILENKMLDPPENCPQLISELMDECWQPDPKYRIDFGRVYQRLELAYESWQETTRVRYESENKPVKQVNARSLPRPPPLPVFPDPEHLDAQGYLLPKEVKDPVQYLETLPD